MNQETSYTTTIIILSTKIYPPLKYETHSFSSTKFHICPMKFRITIEKSFEITFIVSSSILALVNILGIITHSLRTIDCVSFGKVNISIRIYHRHMNLKPTFTSLLSRTRVCNFYCTYCQ